jgi:hypothetical protein
MLYSTVPGPSSGRLGPFVGRVFQDIRPKEKRIINILELGPSWAIRGGLEADVQVRLAYMIYYNVHACG